jgi:hypothetical protein
VRQYLVWAAALVIGLPGFFLALLAFLASRMVLLAIWTGVFERSDYTGGTGPSRARSMRTIHHCARLLPGALHDRRRSHARCEPLRSQTQAAFLQRVGGARVTLGLVCLDFIELRYRAPKIIIERPHRIDDLAESCGCPCPVKMAKRKNAVVAQISHDFCIGDFVAGQVA